MGSMEPVIVGGEALTPADMVAVAREMAPTRLAGVAGEAVRASRAIVEGHLGGDRPVYGLNTGIGALADTRIPLDDLEHLQRNIIRSHAAGAGELLPVEVVRSMMILRARTLAAARSGVRLEVVERLLELLNRGIHPAVPSRGSVGASGDLAPLAHIALALIGEGRVLTEDGRTEPAAEAYRRADLAPLELRAKEGIAMINGTEGMVALGVLAHHDAAALLKMADVAAAMTIEAALGTDRPFAEDLMALRPHPGQAAAAANLRRVLEGSQIIASHRDTAHAVQDPYSMRCAPQVHGAVRDVHGYAGEVLERELGSITDNPVVLPDGRVESAGNFHGEPLAYGLDFLAVGMTGLANVAERRTFWILAPGQTRGLPPFLSTDPGLGSGYMLAQYTQAALVSECKVLAQPAGLDSIPTSGSQEDHVSMGWLSGLKLRRVVELATTIVAVEALCATQALDLRRPLEPAPGTGAARSAMRERISFLQEDRTVAEDIELAEATMRDGALIRAVEDIVGALR
jgi:histidine ammonia-lyase